MGKIKIIIGFIFWGLHICTSLNAASTSTEQYFTSQQKLIFIEDLISKESTEASVVLDLQEIINGSGNALVEDFECWDSSNPRIAFCRITITRNSLFDEIYLEKFLYSIVFYVNKSPYRPSALKVAKYEAISLTTERD